MMRCAVMGWRIGGDLGRDTDRGCHRLRRVNSKHKLPERTPRLLRHLFQLGRTNGIATCAGKSAHSSAPRPASFPSQ
eukprot:1590978-Rhodomonas_salina.1